MVKAIIFDNFGVLTADLWHEFTVSLPPEQAQPARDLNRAYGAGLITKSDFLKGVSKITRRAPKEIDQLMDRMVNKNFKLLDYIKTLKPQYKIGLLSNVATSWIRDVFLTKEEQKLFDNMVFSFEVGITKPDPRIFELACERLGVDPKEAVLVDDIEHYCTIARETGMQAIVYEDFTSMKQQLEKSLADSNN
jgi:putative hydrolase of the HAD superfamily